MKPKRFLIIMMNFVLCLQFPSFAWANNATLPNPDSANIFSQASNSTTVFNPAPEFQTDASFNFRGIRWGMSVNEVKAIEAKKITNDDTNNKTNVYRIGYKDVENFGDKYWLVYSFLNNQCWGGSYAVNYAEPGAYERMLEALTKSYGPGKVVKDIELEKTLSWQNGDTFIALTFKPETRQGRKINLIFVSESLAPFSYHQQVTQE